MLGFLLIAIVYIVAGLTLTAVQKHTDESVRRTPVSVAARAR